MARPPYLRKGPMLRAFVLILAFLASPAMAHFSDGAKIRTIVVTESEGGLSLHVRAPAPLVFAEAISTAIRDGAPLDLRFMTLERTDTGPVYRLDPDKIAANRAAFDAMLARTLILTQKTEPLVARASHAALRPHETDDALTTADEAIAAIGRESTGVSPDFGDALIDYRLTVTTPSPDLDLTLVSGVPRLDLPRNVTIENRIIDARTTAQPVSVRTGQLDEPVTLAGSTSAMLTEFTWQGMLHIWEGLDHVLLVVCLALGVGATRALIWLVTAFTLGHSVTLALAFFGYVPAAGWFIPAVETAIAASVAVAAFAALGGRIGSPLAAGLIGLLHGLGFAFVLGEILGTTSPNLIPALAAFNVGIEIGQLVIVALTLVVLEGILRLSERAAAIGRRGVLIGIGILAASWTIERGVTLLPA